MGLNCRRDQRAWIKVLDTPYTRALGLDQLNGHVVETKHLHPDAPGGEPTWVVDPPQACRVTAPVGFLMPGDRLGLIGVPDAYLRPFDDFPPEELADRLADRLLELSIEGIA